MDPNGVKIAISGDLGSGKSTVCKLLQKSLGYPTFSMGEAWRRLAEKYGMSILELNKYSETHPLDEEMDESMAARGREPGNLILDARLAWHFVPHSFKIHLIVNSRIAATRILYDPARGDAEEYKSLDEAVLKISARKTSETQRYLAKYNLDCSDLHNYNLVVDTSSASPQAIAELIVREIKKWSEGHPYNHLWISPLTPFPMNRTTEYLPTADIVSLIKIDHDYFVFRGISQITQAIREGIALVPAVITACNDEIIEPPTVTAREYVNRNCSFQLIHAWEAEHNFKFPYYPLVE